MGLRQLPKCGAKARSNNHLPCRQIAMANGRCYYHGGASLVKHGKYTKKAVLSKKEERKSIDCHRDILTLIGGMISE